MGTGAEGGHEAVVDAHVHLLPPRLAARVRRVFDAHLPGQLAYATPEPEPVLTDLAAAGADTAWVLPYAHAQGVASWLVPATADLVADLGADDHGVDLVLGASVHPADDDPGAIVEDAVAQHGARVLKLHCAVGGYRPDDPRLDPVWTCCSELRLPVVLHAGGHPAGIGAEAELPAVDAVATRYPELRLIVAHTALPATSAALELLERHPNVHADLTPVVAETPALTDADIVRFADRLLFGSDSPNTGIRVPDLVTHWRARDLPSAVTGAILGGTARRLAAEVRA